MLNGKNTNSIKSIPEQVADVHSEMRELRFMMADLQDKLAAIQRRCLHPNDKRVVVTDLQNKDYTSCDDCGKLFET
jgi:hypothetical protein